MGTLTAQLTCTDDFGIIDTLSTYLVEEGWTVELRPIQGARNGYTDPEETVVVLDADHSPEHMAKTLIHETAHVLLGHTEDMTGYLEHRGPMETEAESVAYSVGYIAGWSEGDDARTEDAT